MNGIDWKTIGEPTFVAIVDTLLPYEFGSRGQPVEGRGGEGPAPGDYSVDDGDVVVEYKYFPEGFPQRGPRQPQIKRSFTKASKRKPQPPSTWILIVPTKLTVWEQNFMRKLAGNTGVKVEWRDRVWLDQGLIDRPNIADYYRHRSDDDYLMDRAALLKDSALIARPEDVVKRVRRLVEDMGEANPHWGYDVSATHTGDIVQALVPKHPNAQLLDPVSVTFGSLLPVDSAEAQELRKIGAFGEVVPVTIPGDLVKDYKVTGPAIAAQEGPLDRLVIHPPPPGEWVDIDLTLVDEDDVVLGSYQTRGQFINQGPQGVTVRIEHTRLLAMTYRIPYEAAQTGGADFTMEEVSGGKIRDVFEVTDFSYQLSRAARLRIAAEGRNLAIVEVNERVKPSAVRDFKFIRDTADDLLIIEKHARTKFRYPKFLDNEDWVNIRNFRLMFEGHWVAHPIWTGVTVHLSGEEEAGIKTLLNDGLFWLIKSSDEATVNLLDHDMQVKNLCYGGIFTINPDDLREAKAAFERGDAAGQRLRLQCRPGDRIRMLISADPSGTPREIEPWNLDGFNQKGLHIDGTPFAAS